MCFLKEDTSEQTARCIKSRTMNKVIDYIPSIDTFEQQFVVPKGMLQSPRLKYHVHTIGIDLSLSNNAIYEHKCLESIKKIYKQAGKCNNQQKFKYIIEAAMVSTPEGFTNNSPIYPMTEISAKKPSAQKPLCVFTNIYKSSCTRSSCTRSSCTRSSCTRSS